MCLCLNESSLGLTRNRDTSTAAELEHPLVTQHAQGPEHRIRVDTQHRSHVTSWREPFAGTDIAIGDVSADLGSHLLV